MRRAVLLFGSLLIGASCGTEHSGTPTQPAPPWYGFRGSYYLTITLSPSCTDWPTGFPPDSLSMPMQINISWTTPQETNFQSAPVRTGRNVPAMALSAIQSGPNTVNGVLGGTWVGAPPESNYILSVHSAGRYEAVGSATAGDFAGHFGAEIKLLRNGVSGECTAPDHSFVLTNLED